MPLILTCFRISKIAIVCCPVFRTAHLIASFWPHRVSHLNAGITRLKISSEAMREVSEEFGKLKEGLMKLLKEGRIVRASFGADLQSGSNQDWVELYAERVWSEGVAGVFVGEESVDVALGLFDWRKPVLYGPDCWQSTIESVSLTGDGFLSAVKELVQISREGAIHIADFGIWPWQGKTWENTREILTPIIELISQTSPLNKQRELVLHTSDKDGRKDIARCAQYDVAFWEKLSKAFGNIRIRIKVWPHTSMEGETKHDRHFITQVGAISFSNSFQAKPGTCNVAFLSPSEREKLRRQYVNGPKKPIEDCWVLPVPCTN